MAIYIWPPVSVTTLPPAGGATSANQATEIAHLADIETATEAINTKLGGRAKANDPVRRDYSLANVTTAAYVELVAATTLATSQIEIFDSSGQTLALAIGASSSEVDQVYIVPGGNKIIPLLIPAASRVSVKAVSANATEGELVINFYT